MTKLLRLLPVALLLSNTALLLAEEAKEPTPKERLQPIANFVGAWEGVSKDAEGKEAKVTWTNDWTPDGDSILSVYQSANGEKGVTLVGWDSSAGAIRNKGFYMGKYSLDQVWTALPDGNVISISGDRVIFTFKVTDDSLVMKAPDGGTWTYQRKR
jgi:hypothetical protein